MLIVSASYIKTVEHAKVRPICWPEGGLFFGNFGFILGKIIWFGFHLPTKFDSMPSRKKN